MINWVLVKNPLNWLVVGVMLTITFFLLSLISAPLRAAKSAQ